MTSSAPTSTGSARSRSGWWSEWPTRPSWRSGCDKARTSVTAIPQLSDDVPDLDLETGYAVQRLLREGRGELVGWKLGVTSRAKQQQVGVDSPIYGFLATDHVLDVGEPLATGEHINPRCEPEIVFVMGRDLAGAHVTATEVLAATAGVAVGIEVLDSRYTDYRFTMPDVVADNASAGRYVIGTPVPPDGIDLRLVGVVLEHNGDVVAHRVGGRVARPPGRCGRLAGPVARRRPARGCAPAT